MRSYWNTRAKSLAQETRCARRPPLSSCAQPSVCVNELGPGTIWALSGHAGPSNEFYWTQWGISGDFCGQIMALADDMTGDPVYAAYC